METYRVLTLDGGGIKGAFTATLLERLERDRPGLLERCDLIAGTSVGGILALALAAGVPPAELTALVRERAPQIFVDSFVDDVVDLGKAVGADYSHRGLRRALIETFGETLTLGGLAKRVLIPSFDLDAAPSAGRPRSWKPKFFHNYPGPDSDAAERVVDVALRTSSAPTYFPSHQGYVDGGVIANNPSMAALAQALDPRTGARRQCSTIALLSVGSGLEPKYIPGRRHDWGWGQ